MVVVGLTSLFLSTDIVQGVVTEEGSIVAMGGEAEVERFHFPYIMTDFEDIMESYEYMSYELEGEAGYYQIARLAEKGDETYRFNVHAGGGIHTEIEYHIIGDLLIEGEYGESDERSFRHKELEGGGRMYITHDITLDATFYNKNDTLKEVDIVSRWGYRGKFSGVNVAFYESEGRDISLSYHDVDVTLNGFKTVVLYLEFHEAPDLFNLGEIGTNITHYTPASMEGIYEGELNIRGLPDDEEEKILRAYNLTDFPIRWEDLDTDLKGPHLGVIEETDISIYSQFNYSSLESMTLEDGRSYDVRPIDFHLGIEETEEIGDIYGRWWYSSQHGFIVAADMGCTYISDELSYVIGKETINMEPMDEAEALRRMRELQNIPPLSPIETMIKPPWAYLIMAALLTVALTVYFYRYKKRKDG